MDEQWTPVLGYEGLYEVSDHGSVRSLDRRLKTWFGTRASRGRLLKIKTDKNGYLSVQLQEAGRPIYYALVHRLVLEGFKGPAPERTECRHGDGVRANCRLTNLSWGTHVDNMRDQVAHGTQLFAEDHPNVKLTDALCDYIRNSPKSGAALARELGVNVTAVCKVRRGETHRRRTGEHQALPL